MTRFALYLRAFAVVVVAVLATTAAATAAPVPDSQFVQSTFTTPDHGFAWWVYLSDPSGQLPSAGCALAPGPRGTAQLTADISGWEGPITDDLFTRVVFFHANVHGTISDTSGNVYRVNGTFTESGTTWPWPLWEVPFDGDGHLTVAGPAGVVTGDASFDIVADNPVMWGFRWTDIQECSIR